MNGEYGYPKDDELEQLIAAVERNGMLTAPVYLKQEILTQAKAFQTGPSEAPSIKVLLDGNASVPRTGNPKASARIKLFIYGAKMIAAAAAAVFVLLTMPVGWNRNAVLPDYSERERQIEEDMARDRKRAFSSVEPDTEEKNSLAIFMNEKSNELCDRLYEFSNLLIMEGKSYD